MARVGRLLRGVHDHPAPVTSPIARYRRSARVARTPSSPRPAAARNREAAREHPREISQVNGGCRGAGSTSDAIQSSRRPGRRSARARTRDPRSRTHRPARSATAQPSADEPASPEGPQLTCVEEAVELAEDVADERAAASTGAPMIQHLEPRPGPLPRSPR